MLRADYTQTHILDLLKIAELPTIHQRREALPLYLWRTHSGSELETFVRLFLMQQSVSLDDALGAVEPTCLDDWADVGLLHINEREVSGAVELTPFEDLLLAADWPDGSEAQLYQVMGVGASSRTLAQAMIRRHCQRALDLGTGCGVLAFLAARQSDDVVAVDSNPRAVLMARLNADLNGISNVHCLEGNLFEPVRNQTFDLIVCNPPFVIAPRQIQLHTHSGMPADEFCRTIVRTAPAFLRRGGYCQLLCNWAQIAGEDWRERLASWFQDTGCDAWILYSHTEDAADYALKRTSEMAEKSDQVAEQFKEWMAYYDRERIEAIGFGIVTMRRGDGAANWFRCDPLPTMIGPCGDAIEQGFALRDFLERNRDDRRILESRLCRAPKLRWQQQRHTSNGDGSLTQSILQLTAGLSFTGNADLDVVEFVGQCNGERRLMDHLTDLAAAKRQSIETFAPSFLKLVRRLVELGFILPVEGVRNSSGSC